MYSLTKREDFLFPKGKVTYYTFSKCNLSLTKDRIKFVKTNEEFTKECYEEFKKRYIFHPFRQVVDNRPDIWLLIFIASYEHANSYDDVRVPNGCCNQIECPVILFYEIIYEKLKREL